MNPKSDGVTLPKTTYTIDYKSNSADIWDGKILTKAVVRHQYRTYVVLSYVYKNVHYTDTLFSDGTVISQLSKAFLYQPAASLFYSTCKAFR